MSADVEHARPMACCPTCGEPLVSTFEWSKKEWICMACIRLWEWLQARDGAPTPEMEARYQVYRIQYDAEREQRRADGTFGQWPLATAVARVVGPLFAVGHEIGNHYWLDTKSDPPTYHWSPDA